MSIKATTIISKAESFLNKENNRQIKDAFLEKYTKCEVLCRPILKDYLIGNGENVSDEDIGMDLGKIKNALSNAGYFFDDAKLLTRIWGKETSKGKRSCRILRNKITHELMIHALEEVVIRKDDLNKDMDKFIEVLTTEQ